MCALQAPCGPCATLSAPRVHVPCGRVHALPSASQQQAAEGCSTSGRGDNTMRKLEVYAASDLHVDYTANKAWLRDHVVPHFTAQPSSNTTRVLIVAGDISDCIDDLRETLGLLKQVFCHVLFVEGNHELWVRGTKGKGVGPKSEHGGAEDSVEKLQRVLEVAREVGVLVEPARFGQLVIAPIHAWHHRSWDREPDIPGGIVPPPSALTIADYAKCVWPAAMSGSGHGSEEVALWMDQLNDRYWGCVEHHAGQDRAGFSNHATTNTTTASTVIGNRNSSTCGNRDGSGQGSSTASRQPGSVGANDMCDVITFSHFVPHQELLPEKRCLMYPYLAKAVGSLSLGARVKRLRPLAHVFGHTHFAWDATLEGTRFIQAPLCYPPERQHRMRSIIIESEWQPRHHMHDALPWLPLLLARATYRIAYEEQGVSDAAPGAAGTAHVPAADGSSMQAAVQLQAGRSVAAAGQERDSESTAGSSLPCLILQGEAARSSHSGHSPVIRDWELQLVPEMKAMWSDHYKREGVRRPEITGLAPWVAPRYARRAEKAREQFT